MKVTEIYSEYQLPEMLQLHMLRTAAVAKNLCDNWQGPEIEPENIVAAMLIHDMGNIVKMNPDLEGFNYDISKEELRELIAKFKSKYGENDHKASELIAQELQVSKRILELISNLSFVKNHQTVSSNDHSLKICAYSDQRVGPFGILSIKERLSEAQKRYNNNFPRLPEGLTSDILIEDAYRIEKQILQYTKLDEEKLPEIIEELKKIDIR